MDRSWSLIAGHEPSTLGWILLVVCVGAAVVEMVWTLRQRLRAGTSPGLGALAALVGLRLLGLLALVAIVLELGVRVETWTGDARRLVVLVDQSASLDLADSPARADPGEDSERRWSRLERAWSEGADARAAWRQGSDGEARSGSLDVEVRAFASDTQPLTHADADALALAPTGSASALGGALAELAEATAGGQSEGAPLAGVLVISDGLVTPPMPAGRAEREHLDALVDALGVPVSAVAVGAPTLRDLAIAELHVGEFAFVENVTEFAADYVAHGLVDQVAVFELVRDGEVVDSQRVRLESDGAPATIRFEVAPDRTGQFVYAIRARLESKLEEATLANNERSFVIKILRDKVRVLHVAGRPDWDVRALRTLLKRDPNVELLSYYILRDWEDTVRDDGTAPLSLIAFPTEELFREQLGSFDLIILHNFDAVSHDTYLSNVADYVREGGSLVIIGGDMGMATGDYTEPALRELLPVDLSRPTGLEREPFSPTLTEAGRRHPITAWLAESGRIDWRELPALDSFNPADYPRNAAEVGATALLVHPERQTADGRPTPLLAVSEPERGRVVTLATGATWRLGFAPELPLIDGARPYDLLWLGAVRWLLRDASAERLILELDGVEHAVGETVDMSVRTLSASYAAEPGVEVEYRVTRLDGGEPGSDSEPSAKPAPVAEGRVTTDGIGRAHVPVEDLPAGAYQAKAWRAEPLQPDAKVAEAAEAAERPELAERDPEQAAPELGQAARRVFLVGGSGPELAHVDADRGTALLEALADRSGGEFIELVAGDALPDRLPLTALDALDRPADGRRDIPLWDGWAALLLAIAALGGEWILRRRVGLR